MAIQFTLARCKTRAGFSAKLPQSVKLNLKNIEQEFETILKTPILLVLKVHEIEIIVHGYGELLFKNSENVEVMKNIAEKIYRAGLK